MELVIDANIIMSALITTYGKTFDLIFNDKIKLFAPEYLLEEIKKYKEEILEKSGLLENDFELFLSLISSKIGFFPFIEFDKFITEAEKITPDINDREYFALALNLNCAIWSNDKRLKEQEKVKVYSTSDLLVIFS